jgi:type IV pilus assembly protein PilE
MIAATKQKTRGRDILKTQSQAGFTLVELMIVVAIIGVMATIAFPSYQNQIEKTRRTAAKTDLLELSQWMERRHSNGFDYRDTTNTSQNNPTLPFVQSPLNGTAFYTITFFADVTKSAFTLQAVPTGGQENDGCGTLTVNEQGDRTAAMAGCW